MAGKLASSPPQAGLTFRAVDPSTRPDFERFFAARGSPHHCWCMVWRRSTAEAKHNRPADRKSQMMARLDAGTPIGLLAFAGDVPVAWVSVAPRETYRNLGGPPAAPGERIWSIACFFIARPWRGSGLTRGLIAAAADHARENGATIVEAYPVDADAPSYRFMGFVPTFEAAGFVDFGRAGVRRHVMRLPLRSR